MHVLILECTMSPSLNGLLLRSYLEMARRHGELELSVVTQKGVSELLSVEERTAFVDYVELDDYRRAGELERTVLRLAADRDFDRIFAPREFDLIRAARLRSLLGIEGQSVESAVAFRDKLVMKDLCRLQSVPTWPALAVDDAVGILKGALGFGHHCVVKPRRGAGCQGLQVIRDRTDTERVVGESLEPGSDSPAHLLIEPFADLEMCHVDGLWHRGSASVAVASRYFGHGTTVRPEEQRAQAFGSIALDPATARAGVVSEIAVRALEALPTPRTCTFHAEIWFDPDSGASYLNEVACRTGGSYCHTNLAHLMGEQPDAVWLGLDGGMALGDFELADHNRPVAGFALPYREGRVRRVPSDCPIDGVELFRLHEPVVRGAELPPQEAWYQALADVLVETARYDELADRVAAIAGWAEVAIDVEPTTPGVECA